MTAVARGVGAPGTAARAATAVVVAVTTEREAHLLQLWGAGVVSGQSMIALMRKVPAEAMMRRTLTAAVMGKAGGQV